MEEDKVVDVLNIVMGAGIELWLDGGWGVDALLGKQTRPHGDLDLILSVDDMPKLRSVLLAAGYRLKAGGSEENRVFSDEEGDEVDAHGVRFEKNGSGVFRLEDGREWPFPPSAFQGTGRVGGCKVNCLSADAQVQCHAQGYTPTDTDIRDMALLQERFGVVLPLSLCSKQREGATDAG
jgi:lincosamide nucleotidyltransferase A/C/D/E